MGRDSWSNELTVRQSLDVKDVSMKAEDIIGILYQATAGENKLRRFSVCFSDKKVRELVTA